MSCRVPLNGAVSRDRMQRKISSVRREFIGLDSGGGAKSGARDAVHCNQEFKVVVGQHRCLSGSPLNGPSRAPRRFACAVATIISFSFLTFFCFQYNNASKIALN